MESDLYKRQLMKALQGRRQYLNAKRGRVCPIRLVPTKRITYV